MNEFGIDLSRYQGWSDWDAIRAHSPAVEFAAARASISWGYQDPLFPHNQAEAARVGVPLMPYHVLYPKQPVISQMDNLYRVCPECLYPRVLDFELAGDGSADPHPAPPAQRAAALWSCVEIILQRDDRPPLIYSRHLFVDDSLASWSTGQLNQVYWWLAQYLVDRSHEHPGPPTLPLRVERDRVIAHQTADKTPPFGVESAALDYDRWQQLLAPAYFFNLSEPAPTLEERVASLETCVTGLEVRVSALEQG
jgi:GH25 family lysozyme M1 (1,4-beta-N-acetylmuramidase)